MFSLPGIANSITNSLSFSLILYEGETRLSFVRLIFQLSLKNSSKNYKKGFYIHYKFEGINETLNEIKNKIKVDRSIIRFLTVKYKKLDKEKEFFKKK